MCGIAGILRRDPPPGETGQHLLLHTVKRMTAVLAHRGPDGEGHWINQSATVAFGHRRLRIIDLSDAGAQPMQRSLFSSLEGEEKRHTITYNGEIYNYLELRDELLSHGYRFQSRTDTEVILAAYDLWEEDCLEKFDGQFAFALWDAKKKKLFAARDRLGEKPFYFYYDEQHFLFGSEMKALWAAGVPRRRDDKMLLNYLALGYVQNANDKEQTFFEDIYALPPGHYLSFDFSKFDYEVHPWWKLDREQTVNLTPDQAVERFSKLFSLSVSRRLRSDVETASSLSGGLDSSSIAATIAQGHWLQQPQRTFSAIFPGFEKDESRYIQSITSHFSLPGHPVIPDAAGLADEFDTLFHHQEEPFQSASIYAQYKVFETAGQEGVKVMLDGQGADEILGGYPKYIHWYIQQLISRKQFAAAYRELQAFRKHQVPVRWGFGNWLATYLPAHAALQLESREYRQVVRLPDIHPDFKRTLRGREWEGIHKPIITKLNDILWFNSTALGLEELLRFADRNSMAHGVEVRLPFLQHQLVEFLFSLPANYKMHNGWTKWLLRKAMAKKLPTEIVWRRDKTGFEPPQRAWMQHPLLRERVQAARQKLVQEGVLLPAVLDRPLQVAGAHEKLNYDWRYLCAAALF